MLEVHHTRSASVMTSTSAGPSCANAAASASSSSLGVGDAGAVRAAQPCVLGEVRVVQRGLPHVPFRGALFLGDLAELRVVEQHVRDGHVVLHRGVELGEVLAEAAVAGDRDDRPVGRGGPRAHRGGEAEADRAEVARHQHVLAACTRSSGRTNRCCCRRRRRSPRCRARAARARRTARPTRRRARGRR